MSQHKYFYSPDCDCQSCKDKRAESERTWAYVRYKAALEMAQQAHLQELKLYASYLAARGKHKD